MKKNIKDSPYSYILNIVKYYYLLRQTFNIFFKKNSTGT